MKNSIKILATVGIVFLLSFSMYAQTDNWSGAWNTKYGKITISKNGNDFTGSFPKGKLFDAREQDGMLLGRYTRMAPPYDKSSLGKKGEFRFILSADKKKFDGYHKSETDVKWGSVNWNGEKIIYELVGTPVIIPLNTLLAEEFKWTGTWESEQLGKIKILVTDKGNITGKCIKTKIGSDYIKTVDLTGSTTGSDGRTSARTFGGRYVDSEGKSTYFTFYLDRTSDDKFAGYIVFRELSTSTFPPDYVDASVYVIARRISSAKPNMNTY